MRAGACARGPRPRGAWRRRLSPARSLAIWTAIAVAWLVDAHGPHVGHRAEIFSLIIGGISWLATELAAVAEVTVAYLATAVSWLGGHLASLFTNTGAMFSKVWEGAKIVYSDVVKPVATWLHDAYENIKGWMTKVFGPILKWADRVRTELQTAYKRFVRPFLSALDTSRAVLDMLAKLHVPFAQQLENVVTDVEHAITENYLRILGYVNAAISTLNGFFTVDGLLQRFTFLRTLERDAYFVWRVMQNSRSRGLTDLEAAKLHRALNSQTVPEMTSDLVAYFDGDHNDVGDVIDSLAASFAEDWASADAGVPA